MASAAPLISVVVPAYNEAALLPRTLVALGAQDYAGPYEIVVVDNNSTDATAQVAGTFPGVRVVCEPRQGVCQARQRGTEEARGEIVVSTDADTLQEPGWLSRIAGHFADPDVVCVAGPCRYAAPSWWAAAYPRLLFGLVGLVRRLTGRVCYITATNTAFRRAAFEGYDLRLTQGGDELDLLRRLRRHGQVVWDPGNVVLTSARRLRRGLLYSLIVTFVGYYLLGYLLNRLFGRTLLGMAPPVRDREAPPAVPAQRGFRLRAFLREAPLRAAAVGVGLVLVVAGVHRYVWALLRGLPLHVPHLHLALPMVP